MVTALLQASFTRQSTWPSQADAVGLPFCPRIPLGELGNCYWVLLANTDWIGFANNPQRQREGKNPLSSAGSCVEKQALCVERGGAGVPVSWHKLCGGPGEPFEVMDDRQTTQAVRQWCSAAGVSCRPTLAA